MKARVSVKIPAGWRRVETGQEVKRGDKLWDEECWIRIQDGDVGSLVFDDEVVIRRVSRRRK